MAGDAAAADPEVVRQLAIANNQMQATQTVAAAMAEGNTRYREPKDLNNSKLPSYMAPAHDTFKMVGSSALAVDKLLENSIAIVGDEAKPALQAAREIIQTVKFTADLNAAAIKAGAKVFTLHSEVSMAYLENMATYATDPPTEVLSGAKRLFDVDNAVYKQLVKEVKERKGINPQSECLEPAVGVVGGAGAPLAVGGAAMAAFPTSSHISLTSSPSSSSSTSRNTSTTSRPCAAAAGAVTRMAQ